MRTVKHSSHNIPKVFLLGEGEAVTTKQSQNQLERVWWKREDDARDPDVNENEENDELRKARGWQARHYRNEMGN